MSGGPSRPDVSAWTGPGGDAAVGASDVTDGPGDAASAGVASSAGPTLDLPTGGSADEVAVAAEDIANGPPVSVASAGLPTPATEPIPCEPAIARAHQVVLITGISGSGKSVALRALEDAGFYCVDNLPPELLPAFLRLERQRADGTVRRIAIAVDVRSGSRCGSEPAPLLTKLRADGVSVRSIFLDASTDALVRRFSETRRRHPLTQRVLTQARDSDRMPLAPARDSDRTPLAPAAVERPPAAPATPSSAEATGAPAVPPVGEAPDSRRALIDAIELERELLAGLRALSTVVDTSSLRPVQLRLWVRQIVQAPPGSLTLVFESFAFKFGVPLDADFVFDVRVLPNPHYITELKALTGRDLMVIEYLEQQPEVGEMLGQIEAFLARWLPSFEQDQRAYLTVAIGCTGGQHRSVYFAEQLARRFAGRAATLVRHREQDARA